jgi:hypothetical protein
LEGRGQIFIVLCHPKVVFSNFEEQIVSIVDK